MARILRNDKLKKCFALSTKNMEYLTRNYNELAKKHDRKWIAIFNRKVVAEADSIEEITKAISGHEHPECIVVEYITTEPIAMFF